MVMNQNVMERITGKQIVRELETFLHQNFDSFPEVHERYINAINQLGNEMRTVSTVSVDNLVDAIERQTVSNLFFSWALGIKSNYDHFMDPMARTVIDVDFDIFLRESTARTLPEYEKAQKLIDEFSMSLTVTQQDLLDDVIEYIAYLETIGPKLAHYYGYLQGNILLHNLVPGYHSDEDLSMQYKSMLEDYLGVGLVDFSLH